jgi:hypothetical protein
MPNQIEPKWQLQGLLFENCNCQLVCPGHVRFSQECTFERCVGYWCVKVNSGPQDGVDLAGTVAVIAYDAPKIMIEGNWTESIIIDTSCSDAQANALERILRGDAGGPWQVLARFVGNRVATKRLPIELIDEPTRKGVTIHGLLKSVVETIRGQDREKLVTIDNMYNQVHSTTQVIASGDTEYDDGTIRVNTHGSHGLWSHFNWQGPCA